MAEDAAVTETDAGPCGGTCGPGQACIGGSCDADCRIAHAAPCGAGQVCSSFSGQCVLPGEDCTPTGEFVPCGDAEFPPTCGPGTVCDVNHCEAGPDCRDVVCDASGVCRGIGCTAGEDSEATVRGITMNPVEDVMAGTLGSVMASAQVEGDNLCGVTVTFELRIQKGLYTSAGNDNAVFEIDINTGERTEFLSDISFVQGLAVDPTGALYVLNGGCEVGRIDGDETTGRTFTRIAQGPSGCSRLAVGLDGALYVAGFLEVQRIDLFTFETSTYGTIPAGISAWGVTFLTGLTFGDDSTLYVGEHWRSIYQIAFGGGEGTPWAEAPPDSQISSDDPWNEGMVFDRSGDLWVGVFPSSPDTGYFYKVNGADRSSEIVLDLPGMRALVPEVTYIGIHGLTFGLDGTLYMTNQNTDGNTMTPDGQVLAYGTDGSLRLLSSGINFDFPLGYDGDIILGTEVPSSEAVPVQADGSASVVFDAPIEPGPFEVRAFVTDPSTGRVFRASAGAVAR